MALGCDNLDCRSLAAFTVYSTALTPKRSYCWKPRINGSLSRPRPPRSRLWCRRGAGHVPRHPPDLSQPFYRFPRTFFSLNDAGSCAVRAPGVGDPSRITRVPCGPIAVQPWQSSPPIWSNQRPNGRLWATLPVGLARGNGSRLIELPTTAYAGGPSFVDACMPTASERSLWSV